MGGVLMNARMAEAFESNRDSFGAIGHGYTYSGHPVGCAAALETLRVTAEIKPHLNAAALEERFLGGLARLKDKHACVGDVRGKGLMACVELVSDRAAKTPLDKKAMARVADRTFEAGALIRVSGNNIILSPPLIIEPSHVDAIVTALDAGLSAG
jgi:adenosylmethionine-8-amino-7-oxononanoate aminotransferase